MLCKKREGVSREKQQPDDGRELVVVRLPKMTTLGRDGNEGHSPLDPRTKAVQSSVPRSTNMAEPKFRWHFRKALPF